MLRPRNGRPISLEFYVAERLACRLGVSPEALPSVPTLNESAYGGLQPLATDKMPLDVPPPRGSRFGSPQVLSRMHWVRPDLVAGVNRTSPIGALLKI